MGDLLGRLGPCPRNILMCGQTDGWCRPGAQKTLAERMKERDREQETLLMIICLKITVKIVKVFGRLYMFYEEMHFRYFGFSLTSFDNVANITFISIVLGFPSRPKNKAKSLMIFAQPINTKKGAVFGVNGLGKNPKGLLGLVFGPTGPGITSPLWLSRVGQKLPFPILRPNSKFNSYNLHNFNS